MPREVLACSLCEKPLFAHCDTGCDWYACGNKDCDARMYDLRRGILRYMDGHTIALGDVA